MEHPLDRGQVLNAVRNPLTVIVVFVLFVEGVAAFSLTSISITECQRWWFVYFCVIFPSIVFAVFSLIVVFKPSCLYGPGDFKDEKNFVDLMKKQKNAEEIRENIELESEKEVANYPEMFIQTKRKIQYSERFAIKKLEKQFGLRLHRDHISESSNFIFDAVGKKDGEIYRFEVKYCPGNAFNMRIVDNLKSFFDASCDGAINVVTIVSEKPLNKQSQDSFKEEIFRRYCADVVFYSFS